MTGGNKKNKAAKSPIPPLTPQSQAPQAVHNAALSTSPAGNTDRRTSGNPTTGRRKDLSPKDKKQNRYFIAALIIMLAVLMMPMAKIFAIPLLLATTFATLFHPFYKLLTKLFWGRKTLGAIACCLSLVFCVLIPTYFVGYLITRQAIDLYATAEPKVLDIIQKGDEGLLGQIKTSRYLAWVHITNFDWRSSLQEGIKTGTKMGTYIVNKTSVGLFGALANIFIMLFTMFYLFIDGEAFIRRLRYLSPLRTEYEDIIFTRFLQISRGTVKATLIIGLVQGSLGSLTLLIFGVQSWLLWGVVMVVLSIVPLLGTWLVLIPAAIIQALLGNVWQGVAIFLISTLIISNIDNLIRPRIVGQEAKMHDLLIFFATIGGIAAFGIMGFIVGPVIAALFVAIIDIYGKEFQEYLDEAG
jgi:predicted PurR-regulated permease PerM